MTLKDMVEQAVQEMIKERGESDIYHPELGWVVLNNKPTHALIAFFKKYERKRAKADERPIVKKDTAST